MGLNRPVQVHEISSQNPESLIHLSSPLKPSKVISIAAMVRASQIISVVLRVGECISAIIVIALLGRFFHLLDLANGIADSRLVYASVIAGISIFLSLLLILPMKYSFYCFPLDGIIFICSIVAFGLLANVSGHQRDVILLIREILTQERSLPQEVPALLFGIGTTGAITGVVSGYWAHQLSISIRLDAENGVVSLPSLLLERWLGSSVHFL
jgi:hypothetical protein